MYYANCEWYVDMGEHYKPLCERNSLRPAKCSECPVYIGSIEAENAKLREFAQAMAEVAYEGQMLCDKCRFSHGCYNGGKKEHEGRGCQWLLWARELGIEVIDG